MLQRIPNLVPIAIVLILVGCTTGGEISLHTPAGDYRTDLEHERARRISTNLLEEIHNKNQGLDRPIYVDLMHHFAFHAPRGCTMEKGAYLETLGFKNRRAVKAIVELLKLGQVLSTAKSRKEYFMMASLTSDSVWYNCGERTEYRLTRFSNATGKETDNENFSAFARIGLTEFVGFEQQLVVLSMRRDRMFLGLKNREVMSSFVEALSDLYGGPAAKFSNVIQEPSGLYCYSRYDAKTSNIEVDGNLSNRNAYGIVAVFVGNEFIHMIDLLAVTGKTDRQQWDNLLQPLRTFQYVGQIEPQR